MSDDEDSEDSEDDEDDEDEDEDVDGDGGGDDGDGGGGGGGGKKMGLLLLVVRCQPARCGAPARNTAWLAVVTAGVVLQVLINGVRDPTIANFGVVDIPWGIWVAVGLWPVLMTCVDEGVKKLDAKAFNTFNRELRQVFETRLGMHSPQ